jgi:eukaryotic-like serine/threonine-protein kinase
MIDAPRGAQSMREASFDSSLEQIISEQVKEWMSGARPPVKLFLSRHVGLYDQPTALVELINQEIVLRQMRGESPRPEDYLVDFPDLAEPLSRLFEIHGALSIPPELRPAAESDSQTGVTSGPRSEIASAPRIPGYEVQSILGRGGMGIVYLARHQALDRKVALKVLHEVRQNEPEHRARFEREAAAVAKCQHPNLVQIHEIGEFGGQSYIVLEYVEGQTLARALAGVPQPPRDAAALVETLARAIDHAHTRGVIHRDLKPANVLLTADGQPKITDFGLAKIDEGTTRTEVGAIMGTLAYMAPEQALGGAAKVGPRADIYALGAILYESLTGRPPFRAESPEMVFHQLIHSDVAAPSRTQSGVPRDLEAICLKCLEKSPARRYASALELADDLRRFQRGDPIRARRIGTLRRFAKWTHRHPWQMTAATTAITAGLAFVVLTYRHNLELEAEVERTQAQTALARLNYQEARSAIQAMLGRLDDRRHAGSAQLLGLRHDQQQDALSFYDRILRQVDSTDPAVRADTARALNEGAKIQDALGRTDLAGDYVRRSLQLAESLGSDRPNDPGDLRLRVDCLSQLSVYLADSQRDQAAEFGRQAIALAERLARVSPDDPATLDQLATCHNNYANTLLPRGSDEVVSHHEKAIEIRERIDPKRLPNVKIALAESLINLGHNLWQIQKHGRAEQSFRRAEELLRAGATQVGSTAANVVIPLGQVYANWSGMLHVIQRDNESIAKADAGIGQLEAYLHREPLDLGARQLCLKLYGNRAYALGTLGRHRDSAVAWTRVVELSTQPVPANHRILLAVELFHAGDTDAAVAQTRLVTEESPLSVSENYNLACLCALFAAAARNNSQLATGERTRLAETHIAEAIRRLQAAEAAGFFREQAGREEARRDPDLAILASNDEFRRLVSPSIVKP